MTALQYPVLVGPVSVEDGDTLQEAFSGGQSTIESWIEATHDMGHDISRPPLSAVLLGVTSHLAGGWILKGLNQ